MWRIVLNSNAKWLQKKNMRKMRANNVWPRETEEEGHLRDSCKDECSVQQPDPSNGSRCCAG